MTVEEWNGAEEILCIWANIAQRAKSGNKINEYFCSNSNTQPLRVLLY